jgi:uncharacterized protein YjiS (DUF1127 family)
MVAAAADANFPAFAGSIPPMPVLFGDRNMDLLKYTLVLWAQHREFRAALRELESYSDRELGELGISRGDIPRLAYEEAERRIATPAASSRPAPAAAWRDPALAAGR